MRLQSLSTCPSANRKVIGPPLTGEVDAQLSFHLAADAVRADQAVGLDQFCPAGPVRFDGDEAEGGVHMDDFSGTIHSAAQPFKGPFQKQCFGEHTDPVEDFDVRGPELERARATRPIGGSLKDSYGDAELEQFTSSGQTARASSDDHYRFDRVRRHGRYG